MKGTVYLVGAGPGAPDLLTLRAARVIARAGIVFHDALVHPEIIALATNAVRIAVGKRCGRHSTAQAFINKRLVDAASKYEVVVRLKGGDPMLFGRAQEEIAALEAAGVRCEIVPGVTAALAAAAEIATSLTERGVARSVAFATPRVARGEQDSNWARTVSEADTGVIYMGIGQAAAITGALIAAGKPASTPVVVVINASLPDARRIYTTLSALASIAENELTGPALILLGQQFRARVGVADAELEPPVMKSRSGYR